MTRLMNNSLSESRGGRSQYRKSDIDSSRECNRDRSRSRDRNRDIHEYRRDVEYDRRRDDFNRVEAQIRLVDPRDMQMGVRVRYGYDDRDRSNRTDNYQAYDDRPRLQERSRDSSRDRNRPPRDMADNKPRANHITKNEITTEKNLVKPPSDPLLKDVDDDPRSTTEGKIVKVRGGGRNTTSFDPKSTLIRPEMRIIVEKKAECINRKLSHDDVVIVPNFLVEEDDWSLYYKLIEEMRQCQSANEHKSEWISWHEGAHLISQNPTGSATYQMIQEKISKYFNIPNSSVGTRFNWYRDSSDWKPYHHDSAAFNPTRARNQNITVGISLGATRELSFHHANSDVTITFPQTNGMLFSFGRDVNIRWKHGIRALDPEIQEKDGRGRISIILWGKCPDVKEEENSPPMLPYEGPRDKGPREKAVCRDFLRNACRHGDQCRFLHNATN